MSSYETQTQTHFRFFDLPPELRNRVYQFYVLRLEQDRIGRKGRDDFYFYVAHARKAFVEQSFEWPLPPLALACKQAHCEIRPFARDDAVSCIIMTRWGKAAEVGFQLHGNLRFERIRKLTFVNALYCQPHELSGGFLQFDQWLPLMEDVLSRTPALQELVIDWNSAQLDRTTRETVWKTARAAARDGDGPTREKLEREADMGGQFLRLVGGTSRIHAFTLNGTYPEDWPDTLRRMTGARVIAH